MTSNFWRLLLNWPQDFENFLMGWLLVLGLKEGVAECATVCIKSEVMLSNTALVYTGHFSPKWLVVSFFEPKLHQYLLEKK